MSEQPASRIDIDAYSAGLDQGIASLVKKARERILKQVPDASERMKWSHPWYELNGSFCYIMAFSKHLNLGFPRGAELLERFEFLEGTGEGMRHVKIRSPEDLEQPVIADLIEAAVELNRP